jgi:uncharacterized protein YegL
MSNLPMPTFGGEIAKNQEPRCLVVLVLDTSYSMDGGPIAELNKSLVDFTDGFKRDPISRKRVEVSIITFDSTVECVQEPAFVDDFNPPVLSVRGTTKMVDGVRTAIKFVEARKDWYRINGLDYYRPHIVLITDGDPDSDQDLHGLSQEIKLGGQGKHFAFMPLGVQGANQFTLQQISQTEYPPMPLKWEDFNKFFKWLSKSISSVSKSAQNQKVDFENPTWISNTGWGGGTFNQNPI